MFPTLGRCLVPRQMNWITRKNKGIQTPTAQKKDLPDGMWVKTPSGAVVHQRTLKKNAYVCPDDKHHVRISSEKYFGILFDENQFTELDKNLQSSDPLRFVDSKPYKERLATSMKKTQLRDAVRTAVGRMGGRDMVVACMDFSFIGGSMGSVVGEKLCRAIDCARERNHPMLIISKSGGARMMEAGYSLMQLPKIIAKLVLLAEKRLPYVSLLTDPTTGGVTASFGMLGDFTMAEPGALIGFAGPRVIRETIRKDLPKGFQQAEYLLEHGFVDLIVDRRSLKKTLTNLLQLLEN